jgi:hypothetical protein
VECAPPAHATDAAGVALRSWNVDTDEIALTSARMACGVPKSNGLVTFEDCPPASTQDLDRVRAAFTATRDILGNTRSITNPAQR